MINNSIKDDVLHISIDNRDFSYRIPVNKLGKTISWIIGENKEEGIVIPNVSSWTLKLFTKNSADAKYIDQFKGLIQENAPNNSIDWKATSLAVSIQNDYNQLMISNPAFDQKTKNQEVIASLEEKYKLD